MAAHRPAPRHVALNRTVESDERVRRLVLAHGTHACSYQILDPGLEHWLAADGGAAVGFVRSGRTWIAAGAPIAPGDGVLAAARAFAQAATAAQAQAIWFLCESGFGPSRGGARSASLRIGAQPVWSPAALCHEFATHRSLRQQLHRAANKAVRVREWAATAVIDSLALAHCLVRWLRTRRAPPLRFLAGPSLLPDLRDRRVFVAERQGHPIAYLLLAPIAARHGWLVEQIVRGDHCCNGTSEALLAGAALAVRAEGASMLTLGCVPLSRRCGLSTPVGPPARLLALARWLGRSCYDFDGVDAFKAKFRPEAWEPLFLASSAGSIGFAELLALARVEAGGSMMRFGWGAILRTVRAGACSGVGSQPFPS